MNATVRAIGIGTVLQTIMVVAGHFMSPAQQGVLFPVVGTLIGLITGWLAGAGAPGVSLGATAGSGAIAGGVAGALGSLVSTALGDVPLANIVIAGGSTLVTGAIGAVLSRALGRKTSVPSSGGGRAAAFGRRCFHNGRLAAAQGTIRGTLSRTISSFKAVRSGPRVRARSACSARTSA